MPEETIAEQVMRENRERKDAEETVAQAAPAVRAAIAKLEAPWSESGLIIRPQNGDQFTPYFVCLERLNGLEHKVVAYPAANTESEARTLAEAQCRAERAAYRDKGNRVVEAVLREHGAWDAYNLLRELKAAEQRAREEARIANLQPVATVLGRVQSAPPPPLNWTDEGKRAA